MTRKERYKSVVELFKKINPDAETELELLRLPINGMVWGLCFSPDGETLATASNISHRGTTGTITLW